MSLYNPILRLSRKNDWSTAPVVLNTIEGLEIEYYYTGERIGRELIDLRVGTFIIDASENLYLRSCLYSGNKDKWKEVISEQVKQHLKDIGVEEGFVKAETRYFEVEKEKHTSREKFESRERDLIHKIRTKKNEDKSL